MTILQPFDVVVFAWLVTAVLSAAYARYLADTVNVAPGERYDVVWTARKPGAWLIHCYIPHHTTNDNIEVAGAGGLTQVIEVT